MEGREALRQYASNLTTILWAYIGPKVHLFAHLTVAQIVAPQSMYELLKSFTAVLDEFGVSHGRAKQAALCAAEGLMMVSLLSFGIS